MRRAFLFLGLLVLGLTILTIFAGPGLVGGGANESASSAGSLGGDTPLVAFSGQKGRVPEGVSVSPMEGVEALVARHGKSGAEPLPDMELRVATVFPNRDGSANLVRPSLTIPGVKGPEPEAVLDAARGRGYITGSPPTPAAGPWQFGDAVLRYRDPKGQFGLLTITCAEIDARFEAVDGKTSLRHVSTEHPFQIAGDLLRGSGVGLDLDLLTGRHRIRREPSLELQPGAAGRVRSHVRVRARGDAEVWDASVDGGPAVDVRFRDGAVFRQELDGGARFTEVEASVLTVQLERATAAGEGTEAIEVRSFDAEESVLFRTNAIEGRAAHLFSAFDSKQTVSQWTMVGPYRVEARAVGKGTVLPGLGSSAGAVVSGPGVLTSRLLDEASETYRWNAEGSPLLTFPSAGQEPPLSLTAERMDGAYHESSLTAFRANSNVVFMSPQGRISAAHAELEGFGDERSLVFTSPSAVDMTFEGSALGGPARGAQARASRAPLHATAKRVVLGAAPAQEGVERQTRLVAEGSVKGDMAEPDGSAVSFASDRFETTIDGDRRTITLTGAVSAAVESRRMRITGESLVIHRTATAEGETEEPLFRSGELRGTPALLTLGDDTSGRRAIAAPRIEFAGESIVADGPVEVMVPADSIASVSMHRRPDAEPEFVWVEGRRLVASLDAEGRPVAATIFGPLEGRGAYAIAGERLTLDFRKGQHSLIGTEGVSASLRREKSAREPGFYAEAPRVDMDGDSQTLTLVGGGLVVVDGATLGFRRVGGAAATGGSGDGSLRLTGSDRLSLAPGRVSAVGSVVATGDGKEPWSLHCDRLDVDLGPAREPQRVAATGNVEFEFPGRITGQAHALRFTEATRVLELDGSAENLAALQFSNGRFEGDWLKCNLSTYLVESGPARLSVTSRGPVRPGSR